MTEKILLVDDEPALLRGLRRQLMGEFKLELAPGPMEGLRAIERSSGFAIVVSDMRMPAMNGIEFLRRVKELTPDTVRMMLTGNADVTTAMEAVNEGNIFRFMTKPCSKESMVGSLKAGLDQYRLIRAERDLLENTLRGSIRVLGEILSMMDPEVFGRSMLMRKSSGAMARAMNLENPWEVEVAAMLSELGRVTLPKELQERFASGLPLDAEEQSVLASVPSIGASLIAHIPRLETVAKIVELKDCHFDGSNPAHPEAKGEDIPAGARILKTLSDLSNHQRDGLSLQESFNQMKRHSGWYDPKILEKLEETSLAESEEGKEQTGHTTGVALSQLRPGMVLAAPITTKDGRKVINGGRELTAVLIQQIKNYARLSGVSDRVLVEDTSSRPNRTDEAA